MPTNSSRMDPFWFIHTMDTTQQWEKLTFVTWNNMDDFHFFEKKKTDTKDYGLLGYFYVIFKNRPHWSMLIEIRIVLIFASKIDLERASGSLLGS